jgi:hypothetical protein
MLPAAEEMFNMILSLVNRVDVPRITIHIQSTNPHAFFSIEDMRYVNEGVFRPKNPTLAPVYSTLLSVSVRKKNYFSCENFNDAKGLLKEKPSIDYQRIKNDLQEC